MRRTGVSAIEHRLKQREVFRAVGVKLASEQLDQLKLQLDKFREILKNFALKNKKQIKKDPNFRRQFQHLCFLAGIDPLYSRKGFWHELLDIGSFYYDLGIQILKIGLVTREKYGGTIYVDDLIKHIARARGEPIDSITDLESLKPLGPGIKLFEMGDRRLLYFAYREFNNDVPQVIALLEDCGYVDVEKASLNLSWTTERVYAALEELILNEICWVDEKSDPYIYWMISHFTSNASD